MENEQERKYAMGLLKKTSAVMLTAALGASMVPVAAVAAYADTGEAGASGVVVASGVVNWSDITVDGEKSVTLSPSDVSLWSAASDTEHATYAAGAMGDTVNKVSGTVTGSGWLIFDIKIQPGSDYGWQDKGTFKVDGNEQYKGSVAANSPSDREWTTKVVKIDGDRSHTVSWEASGNAAHGCTLCLDNVRFVTSQTAVTALSDTNTTVNVNSTGSSSASVDPGTEVAFTANSNNGYIVEGWWTDNTKKTQLGKGATYSVTVYDEPLSVYVSSSQPFSEGQGTQDSPYAIGSSTDLKTLASLVADGNDFAGVFFKQDSWIGWSSSNPSIGDYSKPFKGNYDGNGKTVGSLDKPMFGYLGSGSMVSNLKLSSPEIAGSSDYTGALAARCGGKIQNVEASFVKISSSERYVGGLVGMLVSRGSIEDCSVGLYSVESSYQSYTASYVGGIAGSIGSEASVKGCAVSGYSSSTGISGGSVASAVGGIVGGAVSAYSTEISTCASTIDVTGYARVGGIIGTAGASGSVKDCSYSGRVSGVESIGGIVGCATSSVSISSCLAMGEVLASGVSAAAGGIVGLTYQAQPTISNNVSLQRVVKAANAHRILGSNDGGWYTYMPSLSSNYAFADMLVSDAASTDDDAAGYNGAALSAQDLCNDAAIPAAYSNSFDAANWTVTAGKAPVLKASKPAQISSAVLPGYIGISSSDLQKALKDSGSLTFVTPDATKWSSATDDDGSYAVGTPSAQATINVDGPGWVIFDWRIANKDSWPYLEASVLLDGDSTSVSNIASGYDSSLKWGTAVLKVPSGTHQVTWSANGKGDASNSFCLRNVRFATKSNVSVNHDSNISSVKIAVDGKSVEADQIAPGDKVTVTATAKEGFYVQGWKASADSDGYLSESVSYTTTVYDDPIALYACAYNPFKGSGTQADPYQISSAADFNALAQVVNGGNTMDGVYFKQTADLDCSVSALAAVASADNSKFAGVYDGDNHAIKNYTGATALFGTLSGTIENLSMIGAKIDAATAKAAAMVANVSGSYTTNAVIKNCHVDSTSSVTSSNESAVGGLLGYALCADITGCTSAASVTCTYVNDYNGNNSVGGLIGSVSKASIQDCFASGAVTAQKANSVAGIAGTVSGGSSLSKCASTSTVIGRKNVGGLVGNFGDNGAPVMENCLFNGAVTGESNVGGICGEVYGEWSNKAKISNCVATGTVKASADNAGGLVGFVERNAAVTSCYAMQSAIESASKVGSVCAEDKGTTSFSSCSTYAGMDVKGNAEAATTGTEIAAAALAAGTQSAFSALDTSTWSLSGTALPVLKSLSGSNQGAWPEAIVNAIKAASGGGSGSGGESGGGSGSGGSGGGGSVNPPVVNPDQTAADSVVALIDAIGTVTKDSKSAIDTARKAYDALTGAQQALVSNYSTLTAAEAAYQKIVNPDPVPAPDPTPAPTPDPEPDPSPAPAPETNSVVVNKVTYTVSDTVAKVTAVAKSAKTVTVLDKVKINGKTYKVTAVKAKVCKGNTKLAKVVIGKNVKTISSAVFKGCKKLKTITVKSKSLTKAGVAKSLKGSSVTKVKVPSSKVKAYKKIFTKANCGKAVKIVKK